ncbi:MAG: transposase [Dokdonella sp.]
MSLISYNASRSFAIRSFATRHDPSHMAKVCYPAKGSAKLRVGRFSEPGRAYLVTFATAMRKPVFADWEAASAAAIAFQSRTMLRSSRLLCWVLMPDHWHGLIELGDMDTLSSLVGRLKGAITRALESRRDPTQKLWAEGFHDHGIRNDEDILEIARYIIRNPVRAKLVDRVGCYSFWDAVWIGEQHRD